MWLKGNKYSLNKSVLVIPSIYGMGFLLLGWFGRGGAEGSYPNKAVWGKGEEGGVVVISNNLHKGGL